MNSQNRIWCVALPAFALTGIAWAHDGMARMDMPSGHRMDMPAPARSAAASPFEKRALPALPENLPGWLTNKKTNHIFYKRGPYNYDIYNLPTLAYDLNAVAVGHAMAYEDMVTGKAAGLDTSTFDRINFVLKHPPKLMPDEASISPTFGRRYGVLEQVFDWTHILHAQTVDVLASTELTEAQKDKEIEALWDFYFTSVPYAVSPLPMNMGWLDSQPYSGAFRTKYPKVNGLFWGYHWLQGAMYDGLWKQSPAGQKMGWEVLRERYHSVELYKTNRDFMPMFAETSPRFAARFPKIANAFDNLHMLHDMVNDILASEWITDRQKEEQITRGVWLVSAQAHQNEKPGDGTEASGWHDHRYFEGMPGMGLMKGMKPDLMWMAGMGWMNMAECHHCSMGLVDEKASTVSAEGWTMRVRCALCARDMSAETKGKAILRLATEDSGKFITVVSDEEGNLKTDTPDAVFLEEVASHAKCNQWSQAFTSPAAFAAWAKQNPKYADAKPLTFAQWSTKEAAGTPDTYVKPQGPSENPYESAKGGHSP